MQQVLGQPIVIDYKSGAGGTLGTSVAARAPADGYSVLVGDTGLTYAPTIYPKAGFDFDLIDAHYYYPDGVADEIRASHVLEHFSHTITLDVLREWARVLKPVVFRPASNLAMSWSRNFHCSTAVW